MRITIVEASNYPSRRGHRLAHVAATFADVKLIGPGDPTLWAGSGQGIELLTVPAGRFPAFFDSFVALAEAADGDVVIAVKPQLVTFGAALLARERTQAPVICDIDDLEVGHKPRERWVSDARHTDLSRPRSAIYTSLLAKALPQAAALTTASSTLHERFGGTLLHQPADTNHLDPARVDRLEARRLFGFTGPTVVFPGAPRPHKGLEVLAEAVAGLPGVRLVCGTNPGGSPHRDFGGFPVEQIPPVPYPDVPSLFAAADVIAIPQLDTMASRCQAPAKLVDAMAMGCPIVATDVPDIPAVLGGAGLIVPPGNPVALATAIGQLLDDPDLAASLGHTARARCLANHSSGAMGPLLQAVVMGAARLP